MRCLQSLGTGQLEIEVIGVVSAAWMKQNGLLIGDMQFHPSSAGWNCTNIQTEEYYY